MTDDLIHQLCAIRLEQKDTSSLLPPPAIESWITKAETRRTRLKEMKPSPDSSEYIEWDCINGVLDDIQEYRARIIVDLAYSGDGETNLMTEREAGLYNEIAGLISSLRGET